VIAASGPAASDVLRHCDLNDLWLAVERPSNRSRIVVVITVLVDIFSVGMGGAVEQSVGRRSPGRVVAIPTLGKSCLHPCASITKQQNLVPAKGRWCCTAWAWRP